LDIKDFSNIKNNYVSKINDLLTGLDDSQLYNLLELILQTREKQGTVFFLGNGGSALNACHFSMGLSLISKKWDNPFRSQSLSDNAAKISSLSNDYSFEETYAKLLQVTARKDDLLVILSSSGNSKNLLLTAQAAKKMEVKTFALVGGDGGELLKRCDAHIHIESQPGDDAGFAEDVHMIIGHIITQYLEHHLN